MKTRGNHRILLACATQRGVHVLDAIYKALPQSVIGVCTFNESVGEPCYVQDLRQRCKMRNHAFLIDKRLRSKEAAEFFSTLQPDIMLMVHWRYMIDESAYSRPTLGTFVFHDSLLPKYRGFSPTIWAMLNGERTVGATLFKLCADRSIVDSGPIAAQHAVTLDQNDTIAEAFEKVTAAYCAIVTEALPELLSGARVLVEQDEAAATYACARSPLDNRIDWQSSSEEIVRRVRALTKPYAGAFTSFDGIKLRIWQARKFDERLYKGTAPGRVAEILPNIGLVVLCGRGAILIESASFDGEEAQCPDRLITSIRATLV